MRRIILALVTTLLPVVAQAQNAPATLPYHTVYGRLGATPGDTGPGQAIPFSTIQPFIGGIIGPGSSTVGDLATWSVVNGTQLADTTFTAGLDASFCSTVGAFLLRQNSGAGNKWQCSTAGGTDGIGFGVSALNTSQINLATTNGSNVAQPAVYNTAFALTSPFDWRWTFTGAAPSGQTNIGPDFYTYPNPSGSNDNHSMNYNGVGGTVYSDNTGVLGLLVGGNFSAIRRNTGGGGSTNPIIGVVGNAVAGFPGDANGVAGDGLIGGLFNSYPNVFAASSVYDPVSIGSLTGLLGRSFVYCPSCPTISQQDGVGVGAYVGVEGNIANAYTLHVQIDSRTATMAKAFNAYGLFINSVSGAQNVNAAIRTKSGTVIFGGNEALAGNMIGGMEITPIAKPTINKVKGGATGQFSEVAGGYNTAGTRTYTYQVVAKFKTGINGTASVAVSNTGGFLGYDDLSQSGQNNYIQWTPVEGAISYDIYRTSTGGASVTNTTGKIANVAFDAFPFLGQALAPTPPSYADAGATGDSTSPPAGTNPILQVDGLAVADGGQGPGSGTIIAGPIKSETSVASIGYATGTGAGGAVTQLTSRTTGVTLNNITGAITLFSAAGSATAATFTVTNSTVAATDTIIINQKSGTNLYEIFITAVAAGSFNVTFFTTGGTATDAPVFNFSVIKGSAT